MTNRSVLFALAALLVSAALAGCMEGTTEGATNDQPASGDAGDGDGGPAEVKNGGNSTADEGEGDAPADADGNETAEPTDGNTTADPSDGNTTADPSDGNTTADPERQDPSATFYDGTFEAGATTGEGSFESPEAYTKLAIGIQWRARVTVVEPSSYRFTVTAPSGNTTELTGGREDAVTVTGSDEWWCDWHAIEPGEAGKWTFTFERGPQLDMRVVARGHWKHGMPGSGAGECA